MSHSLIGAILDLFAAIVEGGDVDMDIRLVYSESEGSGDIVGVLVVNGQMALVRRAVYADDVVYALDWL